MFWTDGDICRGRLCPNWIMLDVAQTKRKHDDEIQNIREKKNTLLLIPDGTRTADDLSFGVHDDVDTLLSL